MAESAPGDLGICLRSTAFVDCDHPAVVEFAKDAAEGDADETDRAVRIFYGVRDHGPFADLPYGMILAAFREHYPICFSREKEAVAGDFAVEALRERS